MTALARTSTLDPTALAAGSIAQALDRIGISRETFTWTDLSLQPGEHVRLSPTAGRTLITHEIAELKQWAGFDDSAIREGRQIAVSTDYDSLPTLSDLADGGMSAADRAVAIAQIRRAYLFGDSARVEGFHHLLNWHAAPFRAQVIALGRVELPEGSILEIDGEPAVIMIDEIVFTGGQLLVRCDSRIALTSVIGRDREVL